MVEQNKVKKPKSKPKSAPKLWRDVAQHIADAGGKLVPSKTHPYCLKCKLHELGCKGPVAPTGSTEPKLTVLFEGVTPKEEANGLACEGSRNGAVRKHIERLAKAQNLDPSSIRYLPVTRCAVHQKVKVNYNTKANWCRTFAVDDLRNHPPSLILAIGSTALGALSHKSSAQDWSGVPLNWRGWPDDWLMGKNFKEWGHPSQIPRPQAGDWRQLRAVQAPYIVYAQQSQEVLQNWLRQLNTAVARCQVTPETKNYVLPHYRLIEAPDELIRELDAIPSGTDIDYDVETTGLHAFNKTARLTTAMIRYITADGQAKVLIFPVEHGPMIEHLPRVLPRLARVLHECKLSGHNIAFDVVYTSARLRPYVDLWKLASAVADDTRLMAYALRQSRQSLGLERLAYAWTKSMGGYEEEFVMMMESDEHRAALHPNEGGHYANALDMPEAKSAYIAYTGGDVEVVGQAKVELRASLTKTVGYGIPLADPDNLGRFKLYQTPSRKFAYDYIVKRGIRTLSRMMARGMHVDKTELEHQEDVFPKLITEARAKLREIDPRIIAWCAQQEATVPDWKLDLENRDQLKTILFEILQLPVKRLTESGERVLGEEADLTKLPREMVLQYAAIDKFTINNLVAESPNLAPLKDYRKLYKAYTAFVRSMRNIKTEGIDKSERSKHQYLMEDMCVHPSYNQAGTDSGRISSCVAGNTVLLTTGGPVQIQHLGILGDKPLSIVTHEGRLRQIKDRYYKGVQPMYLVATIGGLSITCTSQHRFLTPSGWKFLSEIKIGDEVVTNPESICDIRACKSSIDRIKSCDYAGDLGVWDIQVEEDHSYCAHGFVNHNSSPNAQQIPRESIIKRMYDSRFGKKDGVIMTSDLSQIELRLLAAACGDPLMVDAYKRGIDLHSLTTSRVFKIPYEHFEKKYMAGLQEIGKDKEAKELDRKRKIGKCVDPATLVEINGKIVRVGSVHPGREPDTFYDLSGRAVFTRMDKDNKVKVNRFYSNGESERLLVCSRRGLVACTPAHPFVLADGTTRKAADLKPEDVLADVTPFQVEKPVVPRIKLDIFGKGPASEHSPCYVEVGEDLAYLLGLFYGDGCTGSGLIAVATGGKPEFFEWQDQIAEAARRVGFEPRIDRTLWDAEAAAEKGIVREPTLTPSGELIKINGSCGRVVLGSTRVSDFFMQLGAVNDDATRSRTLKIPEWMFNAPEATRVEFLAGMFDTDGSTNRGTICWVSKSWILTQDASVMLRSLGVTHSLEPVWNKTYLRWYFRINLSKRDGYRVFSGKLRLKHKADGVVEPRFKYQKEKPNRVSQIIKLEDGYVADLNVNHESHVFCCNGIACLNTTNFLTGYGGGPFGLQTSLAEGGVYLDMAECEYIVEALFDTYPCLRKHIAYYKRFIMDNGCAVSLFGRVRWFDEVRSDDQQAVSKALRAGFNHLIQASASDLMIMACSAVDGLMKRAGLESILVSTVHDSMVIDARRSELPQVYSIVDEVTNNLPDVVSSMVDIDQFDSRWLYTVPLEADAECGPSYLDQDKIIPDKITGKVDWDKLFYKWDAAKN